MYNFVDNTCIRCNNDRCLVGYYPVLCSIENNFTGCEKCNAPENAIMISTGAMNISYSCRWKCGSDRHYNATQNICVNDTVVVLEKMELLNADTTRCIASICGMGRYIPTTSPEDDRLCELRCVDCPALPSVRVRGIEKVNAVHVRKGSCDWVCMSPFMRNNDKCIQI
jgi:hypothetical protein